MAWSYSLRRKIQLTGNYHIWESEEDVSAAVDELFAKWFLYCTPVVNWEHVKWIESSLLQERVTLLQRLGGVRRII